jgi:hypothetical protein
MRYESCEDFFGIYTENPDSCQLLVLLDGEELIGRALVWKLSKSPCKATYFMDRVYTATDSDVIKFNNYCDKEGWMRKYKNNCGNLDSYFFIYKGETVFGEVTVKLKEVELICDDVIVCWGNFKQATDRIKEVLPKYPNALCFGKNKNGTPYHPLALMYNGTSKNPELKKYT